MTTKRKMAAELLARCVAGTVAIALAIGLSAGASIAQQVPGQEEFGMNEKELVQAIERVEPLIAKCMRSHGFQYIANDFNTISTGMNSDKVLPGAPETDEAEKRFFDTYGYGISTTYTGKAPQLSEGYNPARVGIGKRNIEIFKNLSPADQVAYNRALLGAGGVPFAVAIEIEDLSRAKGCTGDAIAQVFTKEQMDDTYYNPLNALVNKDPRFIKALQTFTDGVRKAGYPYTHADQIEPDLRSRLDKITANQTIPLEELSPEQMKALKELQAYELALAKVAYPLEKHVLDPAEEEILEELFGDNAK